MAMRPTDDLVVKTGSYTTPQGETKSRYLKIGTVFTRDDGSEAILIEALPVGGAAREWNGWVNRYPIKPRNGGDGYNDAAPKPSKGGDGAWGKDGSYVGGDEDLPF